MTRLPAARRVTVPMWTKGVIEGMDASVAPAGSLADGLNLVATPAERLAVRGGSSVANTLHDEDGTELADGLRLDAYTPVGMVAVGWSTVKGKHYIYRLTGDAAFFTGTEATSRTDLTASPSTGWNVGPRRPIGVELFSKYFLADATEAMADRQPLLVLSSDGTIKMPKYNLSGAVAATGVLTSTGVNVSAADTVTVGGVTYTFRASVGTTANEVLIGATAAASLANLVSAILADPAGSAVVYGSATVVNPQVTAAATSATAVTATAKYAGPAGNAIATTETAATLSWGAATLTGGTGSNAGPLYPRWVEEYNNVLFIGAYGDEGAKDVPNMVRHSFLGQDPSDEAAGFDALAYNHLGADGVACVAAKKGRGILLVFKPNEIYRVTGFGNAYPGWQYSVELVNNSFGFGVSNPRAVAFAEDFWYGWGDSGPFRTDGYTVETLRGPREQSWRTLTGFEEYWVEYYPDRRVVLFGVRPSQTEGSRSTTYPWLVWVWDIARQVWMTNWKLGVASHAPDFGAGFDIAHLKAISSTEVTGPTTAPTIQPVTLIGFNGFTVNWLNGDSSASTEVWAAEAGGTYRLVGTAAPGAVALAVTGWVEGDAFTVKVRHTKAGITSAYSATTGWVSGAPNTPGITGLVYVDAVWDNRSFPPVFISPATVSFTVPEALSKLEFYLDGVVANTWLNVAAGTVVTNYEPFPGGGANGPQAAKFIAYPLVYTNITCGEGTLTT